jgi:hypothetical protein
MSFDIEVVYQPIDTASYSYLSTKLHGVIFHATAIMMVTTMRTLKRHTKGRSFENIDIIKEISYNYKRKDVQADINND